MGLHRNAELQISSTKVPQMKHNLCQEILCSTVTFYSDQPTHRIAPEFTKDIDITCNLENWGKTSSDLMEVLFNFFTGDYQLGKCISIPTRIYSFNDVSHFYMY